MNKKEKKEKIQRTASAAGIVVASIIGFSLNVYANMYYDLFVTGNEQFSNMNTLSIALLFIILMYAISFLQFLVYDYENELNLDRPFWGRYLYYHENVFWFSKVTNRINNFFITIVKIILLIISVILASSFGWAVTVLWIIFVLHKRILKFVSVSQHDK